MSAGFPKILIPADLSINTEVAVEKALELAELHTVMHLMYVQLQKSGTAFMSNNLEPIANNNRLPQLHEKIYRLNDFKREIENTRPDIKVYAWITMGASVQKAIEQKAEKLGVDLVVIGKKSNHSLLPFLNTVTPGNIVRNTGTAVLTVKPGSMAHNIKTVVVPVTGHITQKKLEAISAICSRHMVKVHLVTFMEGTRGPSDFHASALLTVYQWLRSNVHCTVAYAVLHGDNKALAIMKYANRINADMLLVHPETETRVGWLNSQISDVLPPASKVRVLAVQHPTYSIG